MNSDQHAQGDRRPPNRCSYIYSICDIGAALFLHVHTDIKTHTSMHACVNTYRYIYTGPGSGNQKPPRTQIMGSPPHQARMYALVRTWTCTQAHMRPDGR